MKIELRKDPEGMVLSCLDPVEDKRYNYITPSNTPIEVAFDAFVAELLERVALSRRREWGYRP